MLGNFETNHNTSIPKCSENKVLSALSRFSKSEKETIRNLYKNELSISEEEQRGWDFNNLVYEVQNTIEADEIYSYMNIENVGKYLFSIKENLEQPSTKVNIDRVEFEKEFCNK